MCVLHIEFKWLGCAPVTEDGEQLPWETYPIEDIEDTDGCSYWSTRKREMDKTKSPICFEFMIPYGICYYCDLLVDIDEERGP